MKKQFLLYFLLPTILLLSSCATNEALVSKRNNLSQKARLELVYKEALKIYPQVKPFEGRMAAVVQGRHWGFINDYGELTIPPIYDEVESFSEGIAVVRFLKCCFFLMVSLAFTLYSFSLILKTLRFCLPFDFI